MYVGMFFLNEIYQTFCQMREVSLTRCKLMGQRGIRQAAGTSYYIGVGVKCGLAVLCSIYNILLR